MARVQEHRLVTISAGRRNDTQAPGRTRQARPPGRPAPKWSRVSAPTGAERAASGPDRAACRPPPGGRPSTTAAATPAATTATTNAVKTSRRPPMRVVIYPSWGGGPTSVRPSPPSTFGGPRPARSLAGSCRVLARVSWQGRVTEAEPDPAHGLDPFGRPSLRRNEATCTSRVLVGPYQWGSQTSSRMVSRFTTAPGSSASKASRSNSFGVTATSTPSTSTRRAAGPR